MGRLRRPAALGIALLTLPGCAHDLVAVDGGWRSTRDGYRIGAPGAGWERFELDGAALAFREGGARSMSLQARCRRPVAEPGILARHLVIGIPEHTLRQAGPTQVAGRSGWTQTFDARLEGRTARVKTVTLVAAGCAYDFVLVASRGFEVGERDFDAWIASFSPPELDTAGGPP
jgi:hypothetical protein